MKDNLKSQQY